MDAVEAVGVIERFWQAKGMRLGGVLDDVLISSSRRQVEGVKTTTREAFLTTTGDRAEAAQRIQKIARAYNVRQRRGVGERSVAPVDVINSKTLRSGEGAFVSSLRASLEKDEL